MTSKLGPPLRTRRETVFNSKERKFWPGCYQTIDGRFSADRSYPGCWSLTTLPSSPSCYEDQVLLRETGLFQAKFQTRRAALTALKLAAYDA